MKEGRTIVVIILLVYILALIFVGCSKTIYIPVETIRTEEKTKVHRDSIYIDRLTHIVTSGDTVFVTLTEYVYKDRIICDTVIRIDSIPKIIEIPVPHKVKSKGANWWLTSCIAGLFIIFVVIMKFKK